MLLRAVPADIANKESMLPIWHRGSVIKIAAQGFKRFMAQTAIDIRQPGGSTELLLLLPRRDRPPTMQMP